MKPVEITDEQKLENWIIAKRIELNSERDAAQRIYLKTLIEQAEEKLGEYIELKSKKL